MASHFPIVYEENVLGCNLAAYMIHGRREDCPGPEQRLAGGRSQMMALCFQVGELATGCLGTGTSSC